MTVQRSRAEDFDLDNGIAILRVKGRGGTKVIEAPLHPLTPRYLAEVLEYRDGVIAQCTAKGHKGPVPHEIMLSCLDHKPHPFGDTGLDAMLKRICKRAGVVPRGHHANRRGVAITIYKETKDLVATQKFLGHADPKTTLIYLGSDLDHQHGAQDALIRALAKTQGGAN